MSESTIVEPCNSSGFLTPEALAGYALVTLDWSNMKDIWVRGHPMDSELLMLQQAQRNQAAHPKQRTFVCP